MKLIANGNGSGVSEERQRRELLFHMPSGGSSRSGMTDDFKDCIHFGQVNVTVQNSASRLVERVREVEASL